MAKKEDRVAVTICWIGDFGMGVAIKEGWLVEHGRRPYAQYPDAPFVHFIPKGARKARGVLRADREPYLLVLKGHGLGLEQDIYGAEESLSPDVSVRRSKYSSFDPRWASDFDKVLAEKKPEILGDYRAKKGA